MNEFKKILYATDFSESSGPAAKYACYLARLSDARIHALHVIGELSDQRRSMVQPESFAIFEREVEKQAVQEMEAFCRANFDDTIPYTTEIVLGNPFQQILSKADELSVDLIVMGTHGRTGIEHVIVGSTAERVVRRASVPVLTVRYRP